MKRIRLFALPVCMSYLLLAGCATFAENKRMESFSKIAESFETALRRSDYSTAAKFFDASVSNNNLNLQKMKNIKIVEFKTTRMDMSENKTEIKQDVELQYFRLNSNILHTAHHHQIWRFQPEDKIWLLQTVWPDFGP